MNFLYPGFLFALLSVAIPVIIHLFNFRKFRKIYFSNVQLLKKVKQQNSSTEKLKNLLILCSRILAIVFLVLAFAQPYIPQNNQKATFLNNIVSVYIDNSYSMEAVNKDGNLLDESKRRAKEVIKSFGINDRFQILTNSFEGKQQRLLNADEFLQALDDVKISGTSRTLQQIFNRQATILTGSTNKYSFIISDFQKNINPNKKLETQPDIQYSLLKLNASNLPNVGIDSVWSLSPNHQPGITEKFVVQIKNYGDQEAKNIPLKLTINNQQKALSPVSIASGKSIKDTLSFSGLNSGWQKGALTIKDFPITFDDTLAFSFKVDESLSVLSINGNDAGNYIKALFGADSYYKLAENTENNISYGTFDKYKLIVLNGLKNPSSGLADQLKKYLESGGTLAIFPNVNADMQVYNGFLKSLSLPIIASLITTETKVDKIDLQHPVFKSVFQEIPKNIDLPLIKRYFSFSDNNNSNRESILSFAGGQSFFAKYSVGSGNIYLCATDLNASEGNFARHPIFLPLMYRLAFSSLAEQPLYYNLGNDVALQSNKINLAQNQTLKLVSKNFEAIPEVRQMNGKTYIYVADQLKNAGFYDLKLNDSLLSVYASNVGRTESDMHYLSENELGNLTAKSNIKIFDADKDAVKLISGTHKIKQTLWKLCLILSLVFIATEILLIKFFNQSKKLI
ncbi:hypothetical protein EZJ43_07570 [Pedobacter changchengzhani]|uniref:Aerotolerance regulator N-terminal domain-containing protein n=1 Tax=Pedobacter changchengzhani TaxID=2529274 RepID=A0A4R5ML28_9SPHI|nr:BatA domain-containing protein [Pedobacter changchengzhani]TDG36371.1 hypothetical protein EZJ43_07570 [Pedobacter changchengzhani]